jgi:hypothetical protein
VGSAKCGARIAKPPFAIRTPEFAMFLFRD